jgi:sialic acid synthase SpsE
MKVQVVAELGGIACGRKDVMIRQVNAAHAAGCDGVKLQWLSSPSRLVERRKAADYKGAYESLAFPLTDLDAVISHAHSLGLRAGCSAYLPEDLPVIACRADWIKLASFESGDAQFRTDAANTGRPLTISAGMCSNSELLALVAFRDEWRHFCRIVDVLACVSCYSDWIPYSQRNLAVIRVYDLDGFSDHCRDINSGHDAVLAGARILEVHMRLADSDPSNPDYGVALDPVKLRYYVDAVRRAEQSMGEPVKKGQPCESAMLKYRSA